jgi:hypothetical protein
MDSNTQNDDLILDFTSYIKKFYPEYKFDEHNKTLIKHLSLWANRDPKFNDLEPGWHLDRGIILFGVPGVGKDVLCRTLAAYLRYLRSQYAYGTRIVWEYSDKFMKEKSNACLKDVGLANCYFEELARTDEKVTDKFGKELPLTCSIEDVQSFGNKLLIGAQLINVRSNIFVQFGYQSHFSTNCNEDQLRTLYGVRVVDRLREMCNYLVLKGESKRGKVAPQFVRNKMAYTPPPARETTIDEHKENRALLEAEYSTYLETGQVTEKASLNFYILRSYNCAVAGDDELRDLMEMAAEDYVPPHNSFKTINRDEHKTAFQWEHARKIAVIKFYQNLKKEGAKTIFGIVDVPVNNMVRDMVSTNKQSQ